MEFGLILTMQCELQIFQNRFYCHQSWELSNLPINNTITRCNSYLNETLVFVNLFISCCCHLEVNNIITLVKWDELNLSSPADIIKTDKMENISEQCFSTICDNTLWWNCSRILSRKKNQCFENGAAMMQCEDIFLSAGWVKPLFFLFP